jgi:hypothetical protein
MGRGVVLTVVELVTSFVIAAALAAVVSLPVMVLSGRSYSDALRYAFYLVGLFALVMAGAAQSPSMRRGDGDGRDRFAALYPGLTDWVAKGDSATTTRATPTLVFLVAGVALIALGGFL